MPTNVLSSKTIKPELQLEVQQVSGVSAELRPTYTQFHTWALHTWQQANQQLQKNCPDYTELTIRIVDVAESQQLNHIYRHKSYPTNVLSFPFAAPVPELQTMLLGDLVICAPVVVQEAVEQNKPILAHWAHMVVHGVLHLLDFDHQHDADASVMEALEINILADLGFADPYQPDKE